MVADAARLAAVRADRAAAAELYFASHAKDWETSSARSNRRKRSRAGDCARRTSEQLGRLVDIGTGTGRMINCSGRTPRRLSGSIAPPKCFDSRGPSWTRPESLSASVRATCTRSPGRPLRRQGDPPQVLHYAQSPAAAVAEAARCLGPGGDPVGGRFRGARSRGPARRDAHVRLGFADE